LAVQIRPSPFFLFNCDLGHLSVEEEMVKNRKLLISVCIIVLLLISAGCQAKSSLPNPASVYCEDNEGSLEIRTEEDGGQVGYCVFEDGSECEEWAFFRGECQPSDSLIEQVGLANPAAVYCEENQGTYEFHTNDSGGQAGYCLFADGSACEDWAFYRDECQPGE
jgi:putative hemolysin